jgi:hypothetical protein
MEELKSGIFTPIPMLLYKKNMSYYITYILSCLCSLGHNYPMQSGKLFTSLALDKDYK